MLLRKLFENGIVLLDAEDRSLEDLLAHVLDAGVATGGLPSRLRDDARVAILRAHADTSCAIGDGVAIPHAAMEGIDHPLLALARLRTPIDLGAPDGTLTSILFVILVPTGVRDDYLQLLVKIARAMSDASFCAAVGTVRTREELLAGYEEYVERTRRALASAPLTDDPLRATGGLGSGLAADFSRFRRRFVSDIRDGLHPKILASVLFLYFACLAPAIAFGALMSERTGGAIGAIEMIVATSVCGVVYALASGQPLTILGGTGPLLVFTAVLYEMSTRLGLPFLPVYALTGLWLAVFVLVVALTGLSRLVRHLTRFTDETFGALISIIFIVEAISGLRRGFADPSIPDDAQFLALLLAIGTFVVARSLAGLRKTPYFGRWTREFLADFGPAIAVAAMVYVATKIGRVEPPPLAIPATFSTTSGRPWLVDVRSLPAWTWGATAIPGLLAAVLVYMDQNITTRLVNSPSHRLKKGVGYHLDMLVLSGLVALCSLLGLPWLVAATVRSLNHVRSLADTAELPSAQTRVVSVRENRVSAVLIHALVGASLLVLPRLRIIPMAILYGLFLYMGIASMGGNQFLERLRLVLTDPKRYPPHHYVRRVSARKIHMFTAFQGAALFLLWLIKASVLGIVFPLAVLMLVPLRALAVRLIGSSAVDVLDEEELPSDEEMREVG